MDLRIKTFFLILLAGWTQAQAAQFYAPAICADLQSTYLIIENQSSEMQQFWTENKVDYYNDEQLWEVGPNSQLNIPVRDFLTENKSFNIKVHSQKIHFKILCKDAQTPFSWILSENVSPKQKFIITQHNISLFMMNLFPSQNPVVINAISKNGTLLKSWSLTLQNYYQTESINLDLPRSTYQLEVEANHRIHALAKTKENTIQLPTAQVKRLHPDTQKKYFLIASKFHEDSFVIALDQLEQIQQARWLIQNPQSEKIIVGRAKITKTEFNRNLFRKDKAPYSWEIEKVSSFADFAHIDCDGTPEMFEDKLLEKMASVNGAICFWKFRVVKELTGDDLKLAP